MLINQFLPDFQFTEKHHITISTTPDVIMSVIINHDPFADKLTKTFMKLRELPMKLYPFGQSNTTIKPFGFDNFLLLGQQHNNEIAYGLVGQFWQFNLGLVAVKTPLEFEQFAQQGVAKLVMNFSIVAIDHNHCRLSTETRVFCPAPKSRLRFLPYWYLIRLVSGFIRKRMLSHIKHQAELKTLR